MGIFGLGKKKEKKEEENYSIPSPSEKSKIPEIGEIKKAVSEPREILPPLIQKKDIYAQENNSDYDDKFKLLQPMPIKPRIQEIQDMDYERGMDTEYTKPMERQRMRIRDISEPLEAPIRAKARGPIYVKIEKFESALSDFEEIRKRLHESFELLEKVKSIRGREEEELETWEREVDNIKKKLLDIDRNLFNRTDY